MVKEHVLQLKGNYCSHCISKFQEKAGTIPGIQTLDINVQTGKVLVKTQRKKEEILRDLRDLLVQYEGGASLEVEEEGRIPSRYAATLWMDLKKNHSKRLFEIALSLFLLGAGIFLRKSGIPSMRYAGVAAFILAWVVAGHDVFKTAWKNILRGDFFDENFLMVLATLCAGILGEYTEAAAVMIFYNLGELFQDMAVANSRKSIRQLMDIRPDIALVERKGQMEEVHPSKVAIGEIILVKPGEKVPLDGCIFSGNTRMDTAHLTGESIPRGVHPGDRVLSGFVNQSSPVRIQVEKTFGESTASKVLALVEDAALRKASAERFITKFARYYTPGVVGIAGMIGILGSLLDAGNAGSWIYRGLIFLIVSCPCALVISVPLSFFAGLGKASGEGILIKGGNYLEALCHIKIALFDKTGTVTQGQFLVREIEAREGCSGEEVLEAAAAAEQFSSHPVADSIRKEYEKMQGNGFLEPVSKQSPGFCGNAEESKEYPGEGVQIRLDGKLIVAGNQKLMERFGIPVFGDPEGTVVYVAKEERWIGTIQIYDSVKKEAQEALRALKARGVGSCLMLTGDGEKNAQQVAGKLGFDGYYANLLPQDKLELLESILEAQEDGKVLFVGDGMNDAPVLARADVGISMGGIGSDAAIEASDVVIMADDLGKLPVAIDIAKKTKRIVWQNIWLALGIKIGVLIMGVWGKATLWEAVFADVGVTVLAVLNAMRIRWYRLG